MKYLAVVRRGETAVYRLLKEYLEARGLVQVVWDRRVAERRRAPAVSAAGHRERRRGQRREPRPEASSRTLGFFLARPASPARQSSRGGR
jgi:hypothetical protein